VSIEIIWSPRALLRLDEIRIFVAKDKPEAAERLALRIVSLIEALRHHPRLGHTGVERGVRELVIGGRPYIVLYRVRRAHVTILTIWHGAQRKET
jgi:toxin ParE1/3/4